MIGTFGLLLVIGGSGLCGYAVMVPPVAPGTTTVNLGIAFQQLMLVVIGASTAGTGWMLMLGAAVLGRMKRDAKATHARLEAIGRAIEERFPPPLR